MNTDITKRNEDDVQSCRSPSPRPSPAGRGRILLRLLAKRSAGFAREACANKSAFNRCPLSPGEWVRVRASVTTQQLLEVLP